ncbi:hypothetical protein FN846DRAFT_908123 [Sphaerosporella brunnea]|uniref:Uncharacterized protein n=1 Tax=Sphaerosporella brunnea TaxID=1250544 RepID=A0A5J5EUK9_9PEZI|nr:hypothetical protein FN846DRAFT_908123 [Sphaerosporella brunnea]
MRMVNSKDDSNTKSEQHSSMENPAPPSHKNPIPTTCSFIRIPNELHLEIIENLDTDDWLIKDHISVILTLLYSAGEDVVGNRALDCYVGALWAPSYPALPVICLERILTRIPVKNVDFMPAVRECIKRNAVGQLQLLLKFTGGASGLCMQLGYAILMGHRDGGRRKFEWGDPGISLLTMLERALQGSQVLWDQWGCSSPLPDGSQGRAVSCLEAVLDVFNERLDQIDYPQRCPLDALTERMFAMPGFITDPMRNPGRDWINIEETGEWTWKCRALWCFRHLAPQPAIRHLMPADAVSFRDPKKVELVFSHLGPRFPDDSPEGGSWSEDGDLSADLWNGFVEDDGREKLFPPGTVGGLWNAIIDDILETGTLCTTAAASPCGDPATALRISELTSEHGCTESARSLTPTSALGCITLTQLRTTPAYLTCTERKL